MKMDTEGSGRIPLGRFYQEKEVGVWKFEESPDFLRTVGVLDETGRSGRRVVCVRGSVYDTRGLAAVHAFIEMPYYALVASSMARSQADACANLERAETRARAIASGEPLQDSLDLGGGSGTGADGTLGATPSAQRTQAAASRTPPPSAGLKFGAPAAPNSMPTPKLAPPPPATPLPGTPASTSKSTGAAAAASGSVGGGVGAMSASLAIDQIDDSFFDGLDGPDAPTPPPPPPPSMMMASPMSSPMNGAARGGSMAGVTIAPPPATPPPPQPLPTPPRDGVVMPIVDDEEERDEGDLLPLLDDPDDE